ncbi:hypothetical protein NDU88_007283 [Pleurodeles waltl]|uniref:Uncharacterized protein n=1 Tax=Pleurodeles waltl TaxID=8319 RepID=A0AAV7VT35_PLEWA|nr:hypothetical protein NDU88_007283 [Pleurodeles waltl]
MGSARQEAPATHRMQQRHQAPPDRKAAPRLQHPNPAATTRNLHQRRRARPQGPKETAPAEARAFRQPQRRPASPHTALSAGGSRDTGTGAQCRPHPPRPWSDLTADPALGEQAHHSPPHGPSIQADGNRAHQGRHATLYTARSQQLQAMTSSQAPARFAHHQGRLLSTNLTQNQQPPPAPYRRSAAPAEPPGATTTKIYTEKRRSEDKCEN